MFQLMDEREPPRRESWIHLWMIDNLFVWRSEGSYCYSTVPFKSGQFALIDEVNLSNWMSRGNSEKAKHEQGSHSPHTWMQERGIDIHQRWGEHLRKSYGQQ